jgi:hypothetical protein
MLVSRRVKSGGKSGRGRGGEGPALATEPRVARAPLAFALVFGGICGAIGFWGGRATKPAAAERSAAPAASKTGAATKQRAASKPQRTVERPFVVRPAELFVATDPVAEVRYRQEQSKDLVALLRHQVALAELRNASGDPEAIANQALSYLQGWSDTVTRIAPDMLNELASEIEGVYCHAGSKPAESIVMSRVLMGLPELANARSFECAFAKHTAEDAALWHALDAWRASGFPKTAQLAEIERNAKDGRTRERLSDVERDPSADPADGFKVVQPVSAPVPSLVTD